MNDDRLNAVRGRMVAHGVDALVVGPGADLRYLTGYVAEAGDRLTALLVNAEGDAVLLAPQLEAVAAVSLPIPLRAWAESEDPASLAASWLETASPATVAVSEQLWSRYLLRLQASLPDVRWIGGGSLLGPSRLIKSKQEIDLMRQAGAAADSVFSALATIKLEGRSERQVAALIASLLEEQGLDRAAFTIVAAGPNGASPHHSCSDRVLAQGDMVVLDYGGPLAGYHSDISRTVHIGPPTERERAVYEAVREAQQEAVAAVRAGTPASTIDNAARSVLRKAGLEQYFIHRTGHGLGLEVHEEPYIRGDSDLPVQVGMVFSVEPGVYLPGEFGVRIEDIVVVTADGYERLNKAPRELVVL